MAVGIVVCLGVMATGCAATPEHYGFVQEQQRLTAGRHVDMAWTDADRIARKKYLPLALVEIATRHVSDQKGITAAEAGSYLRDTIQQKAKKENLPLVSNKGDQSAEAKLELAITEMYSGSRMDRIFAAENGAGHAWVQVEGRVIDSESGEELAIFADRRRSSVWIGFRDVFRDSSPGLIREMLKGIAGDVVWELDESFQKK